MAEVTEILNKLLERTKDNRVVWKSTPAPQTFVAVIGKNSVIIQLDNSDQPIFRVNNKTGETIDSMTRRNYPGIGWQDQLRELHELARRMALEVDNELDELLKALSE
ncbi:MAG: hypothetical protein IH870_00745 [Chloroflexi bacterium]|nr:hypothetical protein [Chloroflexota bacterium]